MFTADDENKFIELRAQGWSLRHIATQLHISKRTLVDWNREFSKEIQSLRTIEQQLLQEKFLASREDELNHLVRLQKDIQDEIDSRTLKFVPLEKLCRLSADVRREIQELLQNKESQPASADSETTANKQPLKR